MKLKFVTSPLSLYNHPSCLAIPSKQDRQEILQVLLKDSPWLFPSAIPSIAFNAHGYVGADLAALCREAYLHALTITAKDNQGFALLLDEQCNGERRYSN